MNTKSLVFALLGVFVLIGLFFVFKPKTANSPSNSQTSTTATATATINPVNIKTFNLKIAGRKITSGSDTLTVNQGDEVLINISSDEAEELHLHGYDQSVEFRADSPAELKFTANLSGRFSFELEKSKTEIGVLEVQPK